LQLFVALTLGSILPACDSTRVEPPAAAAKPPSTVEAVDFPRDPNPQFVNIATEAGITTTLYCGGTNKDHLLESVGSGCAFIDFDGDGLLDIYLVNGWALDEEPSQVRLKGQNALYRNKGDGTFENVTEKAGVGDEGWGIGVCAADFDNDGHTDLYITNFGPNVLYRNKGDGTFENVAAHAGVNDAGWGEGAAFFDADGDGDLDLYVSNYVEATIEDVLAARRTTLWRDKVKVMAGPFGLRGGRDQFFRNNGDGTFANATDEAGMTDTAESYGMSVLASDLDLDGDIDVYVANDSNPNFLFRNDGQGRFSEIGSWSGAGLSGGGVAQAGMGVDAADFDGDGLPDLFVTNFTKDSATLYRNLGSLLFDDISQTQHLKQHTYEILKWGCGFFDADCDGDLDLAIANGHIYPQVEQIPELGESYQQLPLLLRNNEGQWHDLSREAGPGFQIKCSARGLAFGDIDNDGDLDLLISAIDQPPLLLRNDTPRAGHWLKVRPLNTHGSPALNARVTIKTGGKSQTHEIRSGSSYASQNAFDAHFGLGINVEVEFVEVRWADGTTTKRESPSIDELLIIKQPAAGPSGKK
jgi:hypothetical protein